MGNSGSPDRRWFDGLMQVDNVDSGIQIQGYEMDGCRRWPGRIDRMLKVRRAKLELVYEQQKFSGCVVIRRCPSWIIQKI